MLCIFLRGVGIVGERSTQPDRLDPKDHGHPLHGENGHDSGTETK
jgi:hypothetical protein